MSLIKCPEWQKEISDKASVCIYCGYPLKQGKDNNTETTDKFEYDIISSSFFDKDEECLICKQCKTSNFITDDNLLEINKFAYIITKHNLRCKGCDNQIKANTKVTSHLFDENNWNNISSLQNSYNKSKKEYLQKQTINIPQPQPITPPLPTCPRCGSTSITTGARGVSGFWGFIGASKTVNRCANCGHTWTPKG